MTETRIETTVADWLDRGPDLVRDNPDLSEVVLTDKTPILLRDDIAPPDFPWRYRWWCVHDLAWQPDYGLPPCLFDHLPGGSTGLRDW